jgi:hypothetical protein
MSTHRNSVDEEEIVLRITHEEGISLEELLSFERSSSEKLSTTARTAALRIMKYSHIRVETLSIIDGDPVSEYEILYPVFRDRDESMWVLPGDYIVYEPEYYPEKNCPPRYKYYREQYKPVELAITIPDLGRDIQIKWPLDKEHGGSTYDGIDQRGFLHSDNKTDIHDRRYTLFECYCKRHDLNGEGATKVFYKAEDDMMKLHCASIPFRLLGPALQMHAEDADEMHHNV